MNDLAALQNAQQLTGLGLDLPSPEYLLGGLLFGFAGLIAYRYGRDADKPRTRWMGLALMLYPYAVTSTWLLYVVGAALCAGVWFDRS